MGICEDRSYTSPKTLYLNTFDTPTFHIHKFYFTKKYVLYSGRLYVRLPILAEIDWLAPIQRLHQSLNQYFTLTLQSIAEMSEYEDIVASNPTTVKERIDEALQSLANLSSSTRARGDILADLAK